MGNKKQSKENLELESLLSEIRSYPFDLQNTIDQLWNGLGISKTMGNPPDIIEFMEILIAGIKMRKLAPKKGGQAPKKLQGILMALEEVWKNSPKKDARSLWGFFRKNYSREKDSLKMGDFEIFFYKDPTGKGENLLYQRDGNGMEKAISLATFRRYVSQVKKEQF